MAALHKRGNKMLALNLSLQLILTIAIGFFVWRIGLVDEKFDRSLSSFILNVAMPCLIIYSFGVPFAIGELRNIAILLLISVIMLVVTLGMGQGLYLLFGKGHTGRVLRFGTAFTNFSFVGIPVVNMLYGPAGILYFIVFTAPIRTVLYSSGKFFMAPPDAESEKLSFWQHVKGWLSPPVLAIIAGFIMYLAGIELPAVINNTMATVGAAALPLGMIICGIALGKNELKMLFKLKYLHLPILRNLILPALTAGIMFLLPLDPLVARVVVIFSALPVALLLSVFTIQYNPDPEAQFESAGSVLISTALFTFTIPLWVYITEIMF